MKRRRHRKQPVQKQQSGNELFLKPTVQTKLNVGKPGDKYEVEADKMADKVVNNSGKDGTIQKKEGEEEVQQKPLANSITPLVQRMEATEDESVQSKQESIQRMEEEEPVQKMEEEEVQKQEEEETVQQKEDEEVQAKCAACQEEGLQKKEDEEVQAKSNQQKVQKPSLESQLRKGKGGQQMDAGTQAEMESGFGADFSNVRIHTDSEAVQMSQDIGAQAFTHGNDIYFNKGKYDPNSKEGKHLLAHELTHTIQQKGFNESTSQFKVQCKNKGCKGKVPFNATFENQVKIPFFSTSDCSKIKVVLKIQDVSEGHIGACTSLNVSIDGVGRTKRTVKVHPTKKITRKTLHFEMKNATKHHLILTIPCTKYEGYYTPLKVSGKVERY
ncbi:eCIS core domain-containing protein [Pseudotenacibaculum haliotis]|uniref:DUF4157 domain-containing protein n=1 Tax=Pseudotenacibaculum haliotis TaxID=1862138 RepID=A0ABW5LUB8_9FLAO